MTWKSSQLQESKIIYVYIYGNLDTGFVKLPMFVCYFCVSLCQKVDVWSSSEILSQCECVMCEDKLTLVLQMIGKTHTHTHTQSLTYFNMYVVPMCSCLCIVRVMGVGGCCLCLQLLEFNSMKLIIISLTQHSTNFIHSVCFWSLK